MSDTAKNSDWWLASDGKWYPPTSQPGHPLPPPPFATPNVITPPRPIPLNNALAGWTQALLWVTAGVGVFLAILAISYRRALNAWFEDRGNLQSVISAEDIFVTWSNFLPLVLITTFVLLIIWLAKAHTTTTALLQDQSERRYSRAWSIGVWFIPLANVISTPQIFAETQKIADAPRVDGQIWGTWKTVKTRSDLVWWWILFVGGMIVFQTGLALSINDESAFDTMVESQSIDDYLNGLAAAAIGGLLAAGGAVCGALFIRHVSQRLSN